MQFYIFFNKKRPVIQLKMNNIECICILGWINTDHWSSQYHKVVLFLGVYCIISNVICYFLQLLGPLQIFALVPCQKSPDQISQKLCGAVIKLHSLLGICVVKCFTSLPD